MLLMLPRAQEPILWAFENCIFYFFCKFLIDEVETIFWNIEAKCSKLFKSKFSLWKFLRKWFWNDLELKNKCSEYLKRAFSVFCKFLRGEIETVFWQREAEPSRPIKLKDGYRKLFRKWFWSDLEIKSRIFWAFGKGNFHFFAIFVWRSWNHFLGK